MDHFRVITVTHRNTNINLIGKLLPSQIEDKDWLSERLSTIKEQLNISELFFVHTCNRVSFFLHSQSTTEAVFIQSLYAIFNPSLTSDELAFFAQQSECYSEISAIEHIFRVAASIDSLVVGEREILRQMRKAYEFCRAEQLSGDNIRLVMEKAIPTSKKIYTDTKIGENSVSVVALAIQKMLALKPSRQSRILLIGAGQTNNLLAKFLNKHEFTEVSVFNRSLPNAQQLARKLNASAYTLDQLEEYKKGFDILISCTAATEPIITESVYTSLLNGDDTLKIVIDLAVPNDVDRSLLEKHPINLIEVEQLRSLAQQNLELRKQEVTNANVIIEAAVNDFEMNLKRRKVERAMSDIPVQVKAIKHRAVEKVFHKEIASLDQDAQDTLHKIISYMEKKYISIPIKIAKEAIKQGHN